MKYKKLFEPIKIGTHTIKNRIFMPPISTNLADKGYVTDELVKHYSDRAKGGVSLIITEVCTVEPTYVYLPGDMSCHDDSFIPGWKKLADGVHTYGGKILAQLFHPAYMAFPIPGTPRLIAPSNVGPYYAKEAPRPVTKAELKVIIEQFKLAALRLQKAGIDGVEIHAAHAHGLLGGFLSPLYNKRTDEYGGDINGRLKLTLEVLDSIREACGPDFIIDVRISGDEYSDGGENINDSIYVSKELEAHGADFIHVSGGTTIKKGSSIPAPGTKMGSHAELAKEIKKYVHIPVTTVGRITEPWIANELIDNGFCDAVMIGRANLCDPDFVNKTAEDNFDEIKPCIGCLRCLNGIMFGKRVACTVNPSFELENENNIKKADTKKNVLVIGGGVAGLEAAYVLTQRGHNVVLSEKEEELGGLVRLASVPIAKQDLTKLIKYLALRLEHTNATINLGEEITKELLETKYKGYEVVLASGSNPVFINSFANFKNVMTADDILSGKKFPGQNIVVVGGGSVGCETADYLAPMLNDHNPRNRHVTIIEMAKEVMLAETGPARSVLYQRMMSKGVEIYTSAKVTEVTENEIKFEDTKEHVLSNVDTLVLAVGYRPNNNLVEVLNELNINYINVGDSLKVGNIKDAITEAYNKTKEF